MDFFNFCWVFQKFPFFLCHAVQKIFEQREVSIQKSSSGSEMEIEFLSDDFDDDTNDEVTVLISTGLFFIDNDGEKWAQCVKCCR